MISIRCVLPFVLLGVCKSEFNKYRIFNAAVPHTTSVSTMLTTVTVVECDRYYSTKPTRVIVYDPTLKLCQLYEENAFPAMILPAPSAPRTVYVKGSAYVFVQSPMNWIDAQQNCAVNGGQLVKIDSAEENELMLSWLPVYGLGSDSITAQHGPWIGLNDRSQEGLFTWADGSSLGDFSYWIPGDPSNTDNEDCANIDHPISNRWNDISCSMALWSICEYN